MMFRPKPRPVPNPGEIVEAERGFSRFHDRPAGQPVYPYLRKRDGIFDQTLSIPRPDEMGVLGQAVTTLYESDKWHQPGQTVKYYHDHGRGVKFWERLDARDNLIAEPFPYEFPEEVWVIGECIGLVVKPHWLKKKVEASMRGKNTLLVSPDGWADPKRPNRCFLAVLNRDRNCIDAMIAGGNLRVTAHGIEG